LNALHGESLLILYPVSKEHAHAAQLVRNTRDVVAIKQPQEFEVVKKRLAKHL
jgi:hypothetical protein